MNHEVPQVTSTEYQRILVQSYPPYLPPQHQQPQQQQHQQQQTTQEYSQYGVSPILPMQMSAAEPQYTLASSVDQNQMLAMQRPRQISTVASSHYSSPYHSPQATVYQHPGHNARKRSFHEDFDHDYQGLQLQTQGLPAGGGRQTPVEYFAPAGPSQFQHGFQQFQYPPSRRPSTQNSHSNRSTQSLPPPQTQPSQQHHHHRLPNQQPPNKMPRFSGSPADDDEDNDLGPASVVGLPGMPEPALRPKGPKLKFTPEDDALLVELKETKNLTWKQIADFFPGRSSGTLQVRYCTKLKAKTTIWTDDMVLKLRTAIQEYDNDRWRIISTKVGNGFSAGACREKALDLEVEDSTSTELYGTSTASNVLPQSRESMMMSEDM
ncbi:hypothetical protein TI39_contig313g00009 [Zymoseptoria brevis]|uniref:Myb-like domain-containing protein n=1 Tax=Zymoseptoria brevis TaxID=1047168 RepID=A0A0F4GTN5_9PEZI|nr:hypothetical protein TI39_contig313g00009 [Zymoseptoria brevis]